LAVATSALFVLLLLVVPTPWSVDGRLSRAILSAAHFPLFALVGSAAMLLMPAPNRRIRRRRALLVSAALAVGVEILQALTGREPGLRDGLTSTAGATAAIFLWASWWSGSRLSIAVARGVALVLALLACVPTGLVLADRVQARLSYPVIASFEGRSELGRWWGHYARLGRVTSQATHGRHALRAVIFKSRGAYPGLFMTDGPRDWGEYGRLCFDVYLVGNAERSIWVRVDDRADYPPYDDRAQTMVTLVPGPNSVCLDLASLLRTPSGRALNRQSIRRWGLFFDDAQGGETFFLDHIRLSR